MLLLARNRVVSTDALIDALWDEPPESSSNSVHVYVSGLRRVLGKDRVETVAPGYLLRVAPEEFDLARAEQLQADGQVDEALALWRGPALADLAHVPFAKAEIARLDELRLGCIERRIERDLDRRDPGGLVGELESLVHDQPFREGFRRQLMLALYRSGRQAEALDAYQDARRVLVAELGIEPGPRLRELHQQILLQDSALDGAEAASPPATGVLTFLISDIQGPASSLWDTEHEAVVASLARLDDLVSGAVESHGGRLLPSTADSDLRVSVFESPVAAVRAAIEEASAFTQAAWPDGDAVRARFGLHSGDAQMGAGSYHGVAVTLAARVCGEADDGEILLSEATAALVVAALPEAYSLIDLGRFRLEGFARPEPIKALAGPGLSTSPVAGECPYRGLLAFGAEDRHLFFGRELAVADVLARIAPRRLMALVGASGSGKSSLLRAGVLAAARDGKIAAVRSAALITPGAEPPLELGGDDTELLIVDQFEELYTQCRDPDRRSRFIEALLTRNGPVVIGVRADFYGELSTHAALAAAAAANQVLLGPMSDEELRSAIVEPARVAGLRLQDGLLEVVLRDVQGEPGVLPLMSHALRETWQRRESRTLGIAGYEESGGVGSALAQTADAVVDTTREADRPLLRNVFLRLTEVGDDRDDARRRASIEELIPEGRSEEEVRALLERLVEVRLVVLDGETAQVAHEVLIRRWPTLRRWIEEDREGIRLHRRLGDAARLWEESGREPADLYRGTRLDAAVEWAAQNGAPLNATERTFLNTSVEESARAQRDTLTTNRRLRRALITAACLLVATAALLALALVQRSNAIRSDQVATSLALAEDSTSLAGSNVASSLLLALAAYRAEETPQARTAVTLALQAAGSSGADVILRSCSEVNDVAFGPAGALAVGCYDGTTVLWNLDAAAGRRGPIVLPPDTSCNRDRGIAFGGGGRMVAVGCANGNVVLWSLVAGNPSGDPVTLRPGGRCNAVNRVAFESGRAILAVACANGNTVLWNTTSGTPRGNPITLAGGTDCGGVDDADFAPGGSMLALGCGNGNTVLRRLAAGRPRAGFTTLRAGKRCDVVNSVVFGDGGRRVAVGCGNGNAVLWTITGTGRPYGRPVTVPARPACNGVSAVGLGTKTLAVSCYTGITELWNLTAGGSPHGVPVTVANGSSCDAVDGMALAPGGRTLAAGCANGNTLLWNMAPVWPRSGPVTLRGGRSCDAVNAVAYGRMLAVACNNGNTVMRYIVNGRSRGAPLTFPGGRACPGALAAGVSSSGSLAVGCANGDTVLRALPTRGPPRPPVTLRGGASCNKALAVAFGGVGETLAVGCANGATVLWHLSAGRPRGARAVLPGGSGCNIVTATAFDPGGQALAVGCFNGNTILWDTAAGKPLGRPVTLRTAGSCDAVYGVAFGPHGKSLAIGCHNGNTVVWDVSAAKPRGKPIILPASADCDPLLGVSFSDQGTLAVSCNSGNVVLWNVAAGKLLGGPVTLPTVDGCATAFSLAFGPGGRTLALGCANGNTTLWNVEPWVRSYAEARSRTCAFVWGELTRDEWNTLARGLRYDAPCRGL